MLRKKMTIMAVLGLVLLFSASDCFARPSRTRPNRTSPRNRHKAVLRHPQKRVFRSPRSSRSKFSINLNLGRTSHGRYRGSYGVCGLRWPGRRIYVSRPTVVVRQKPVIIEPTKVVVWITNENGSKTPVELTKEGPWYVGPLGEYYESMPTEEQLRQLYGLEAQITVKAKP